MYSLPNWNDAYKGCTNIQLANREMPPVLDIADSAFPIDFDLNEHGRLTDMKDLETLMDIAATGQNF